MLQDKIIQRTKQQKHEIKSGRYWATIACLNCPVEMYERLYGDGELSDDVILKMARGSAIHKGLAEYYQDSEMHFEIQLPDFVISGKIDGILNGQLYELKTYAVMKYVPLGIYKNQVEIYLRALQYDSALAERVGGKLKNWEEAILGFINFATFKEKVVKVKMSDSRWETILGKVRLLHEAIMKKQRPSCICGKH